MILKTRFEAQFTGVGWWIKKNTETDGRRESKSIYFITHASFDEIEELLFALNDSLEDAASKPVVVHQVVATKQKRGKQLVVRKKRGAA